jgi:hypothetical protein
MDRSERSRWAETRTIGFWIVVPLAWSQFFGWSLMTLDHVADLRAWEEFASQRGAALGGAVGTVVGAVIRTLLFALIVLDVVISGPALVIGTAILAARSVVQVLKRGSK